MVKTMTAALKVPSLTYSDDVDCDALLRLRKRLNSSVSTGVNTKDSSSSNSSSSMESQQAAVAKISSMPIIMEPT